MKHAPETWYVSYEPSDQMVFVRLEDGKIDLSVYLSNEVDSGDEIYAAIEAWASGEESAIIAPHFTIASPVDYLIEGHQMPSFNNNIDADAKPLFDAIRAEMAAQIARIDALVFQVA